MDWGAIASAAGSNIAAIIGFHAQHKTDKANKENVEATNSTNKQIADEANQLQIDTMREQNEFAHKEAELAYQRELEKMQLEQKYNSPIEQMKRFQEAGINPAVGFSGNLSTAVSGNQTAPQAMPANGISPNIPTMMPFQKQSPFNIASGLAFDGMLKTAQAVEAISKSRQNEAEAKQIQTMLKANLDKLTAEAEGQKLANFITSNYGEKSQQANLAYLSAQATLAAQQGEKAKADAILTQSQDYLNRELAKYHGENTELLKQRNKTFMEELRASINSLNAQAEESRARAVESKANAEFTRDALKTSEQTRRKLVAETIEAYERIHGISLDNDEKNRLTPLILKQLENDIRQQGQDYWNPFHYAGQILGGAGAAGIKVMSK